MLHLDDESIASAAMGESLSEGDAAHLSACATCATQVRELERLMARAGSLSRPEPLLMPPARVWDSIMEDLSDDDAAHDAKRDAKRDVTAAPPEPAPPAAPGGLATVTPIRRFSGWLVASAAAVGLVIGGVGVGVWVNATEAQSTVVASAPLTALATEASAGTARVEVRPNDVRVLVVDTPFHAVSGADLEVWLIDPNIEGMVSLGYLETSHGEFVIPDGYDPEAYPIVDISVEPRDGEPTHSGESITRGVLGV